MRLTSSVVCGPGKIRETNQDNFYLNGPYNGSIGEMRPIAIQGEEVREGFFAVADGMGGEEHGELASLIAVSSLDQLDRSRGLDGVVEYIQARNSDVCGLIRQNGGARSGSTFVGVNLRDGRAELANIGDSRAYLLRGGELAQLSVDHTSVRAMVDMGVISPDSARKHPGRHQLTQHLGIFPEEMLIQPYTAAIELMEDDLLLLCSDGLYDMLEDGAIRDILCADRPLCDLAAALYDAAMDAGGRDNTTVMLIRVKKIKNIWGRILGRRLGK